MSHTFESTEREDSLPQVSDPQGWTIIVRPQGALNGWNTPGRFTLRAIKDARVLNRSDLVAVQVEAFRPDHEWEAVLAARKASKS